MDWGKCQKLGQEYVCLRTEMVLYAYAYIFFTLCGVIVILNIAKRKSSERQVSREYDYTIELQIVQYIFISLRPVCTMRLLSKTLLDLCSKMSWIKSCIV